ncbi:hypothetical protein [Fulvivirga lutimaris]|nr:hypothetical protein [Fulvivirga lutimaris]
MENDTVKIGWKSPATGPKKFKDITLLTLDNDGVFRTHTINFDYFVTN